MKPNYTIRYHGISGEGHGSFYIGDGRVEGTDVGNSTYQGSYEEKEGRLVGTVTLTSSGNPLVTGQTPPRGAKIPISFSLAPDFGNGQTSTLSVAGAKVQVSFYKIS